MNDQTSGTGASSDGPRKPITMAENTALTLKVLVGAGAASALIWAVDNFVG